MAMKMEMKLFIYPEWESNPSRLQSDVSALRRSFILLAEYFTSTLFEGNDFDRQTDR